MGKGVGVSRVNDYVCVGGGGGEGGTGNIKGGGGEGRGTLLVQREGFVVPVDGLLIDNMNDVINNNV